jgi:hypothetical protein
MAKKVTPKTTKVSPTARSTRSKPAAKHRSRSVSRRAAPSRAIHLRITLHPVSLMVALCVGVLLTASTLSAFGESYEVTASVSAPPPSQAAVLNLPTANQHFTTPDIAVQGGCPANSYIKLFVDGTFSGSAVCQNGSFSIAQSLHSGGNALSVQDYNITDQPGPSTPAVMAYYDTPSTPVNPPLTPTPPATTPAATPTELHVSEVDDGVSYSSTIALTSTTSLPTFSGTAPPFSNITILVHSDPITCLTQADAYGFWSCTLATELPDGEHTVTISAITPEGVHLRLPIFKIMVSGSAVSIVRTPPATTPPQIIIPDYHYQVFLAGSDVPISFVINGGRGPYTTIIDWGDGTISTYTQSANGVANYTHNYKASNNPLSQRLIKVRVIDADGATTLSQQSVVIRSPVTAASTNGGNTSSGGLLGTINLPWLHNYLWILWPGYIIIILMLLSFYLGERRQRDEDRKPVVRRRVAPHHHRKKHA